MSLVKGGADVAMRDGGGDSNGDGDSDAGTAWSAQSAVDDDDDDAPSDSTDERHVRRKSVYDAVAGRIRVREPRPRKWPGQSVKYRDAVLPPEEALFRGTGAPERFEETDTYFAHEDLVPGALPDTDLVKAVHHYASHFYEALALRETDGRGPEKREEEEEETGNVGAGVDRVLSTSRLLDERSMDETALLAFGILLEEAGRAVLGTDGDLVFTEAAEAGEEEDEEDEEDAGDGDEWQTEDDEEGGGDEREEVEEEEERGAQGG